jgi:hypothetical protein
MKTDRIVDEIRQLRTARYERLGDSAQAWRTDIQTQRTALLAQGWVFAESTLDNARLTPTTATQPKRATFAPSP